MIPHQNPRNTGRQQPSALQFSQQSFLSQRSTPPTLPAPAAPDPKNAAFRADVRPDFMQEPGRQQAAPTESAPRSAPRSISDQYNQARQQLTNLAPLQGYATEKQRRDYAWEVRNNPLGARDAAQEFNRIYQRSTTPSQQTPTPQRRANFNGPRPRFSA